jgi:hypothetical protein
MIATSSEDCVKSELDIFSVPPTQTSVEDGVWDTIHPHSGYQENSVMRFDIPGTNTNYIDLSQTLLFLKVKMENGKSADHKEALDKSIGVCNNLFHSLFQQIQISLNNSPVENTNQMYAYRAYLENLLTYDKESKEQLLAGNLWVKDAGAEHKVSGAFVINQDKGFIYTTTADEKVNNGFVKRGKLFINKNTVELVGKLHCDMTNINRYIINNVNIQIALTRNKPMHYMLGKDAKDIFLKITDARLFVRRQNISPAVMLAHAMALEKTTAKYPIKRVVVQPIAIPGNMGSKFNLQKIAVGVMPSRVVVGFVSTKGFDGDIEANPFNFQNLNITELQLKVSSKPVPYSTAMKLDFEANNYHEGYYSLFKNIREAPHDISYDEYKNGNTLFAFDLTPDLCSSDHYSLLKDGSLDLEVTVKKEINYATTAIFYMEFDNIIEINKERNILYDYKV